MAWVVTSRGTGSNNTGGQSTLVVTPASNFAWGSVAQLCVGYDNSGTLGADPLSAMGDSVGNTWASDIGGLNDPGAANAGAVGRIFSSKMNIRPLTTSDTITVTLGGITTVARVWVLYELMADPGFIASENNEGALNNAVTTATPTYTTASLGSGNLLTACMIRQANGTRTADADATNGSFANPLSVGVGVTTAGMEIICETKILTATATQTYNPTFGGATALPVGVWSEKFMQALPYLPHQSPLVQLIRQ